MWIDDIVLEKCSIPLVVESWIPKQRSIVLGSSNQAELECITEHAVADKIDVLRRAGGGGTVLLHEGCVIVTVGTWVRQNFQNDLYFKLLNQAVIDCLTDKWSDLEQLGTAGISDLVHAEKKFAGTSMFRSRNYLLYQASLLIDARIDLIERYLRHPTKEPTYRSGRDHRSFLVGLCEVRPDLTTALVMAQINTQLGFSIHKLMQSELIAPITEQLPNILARAQRGKATS